MEPKISGSRFVLAVQDLPKSAEYYTKKLGFETLWSGGGWQFLMRDSIRIMIGECPNDQPAAETGCHSYFAYFEVEHIDSLYDELQSRQAEILGVIENKPWGQREFSVRTIDGHRITFGQEIPAEDFNIFMERSGNS